ncbi:hypothetical protein J2D73_20080 [Acetobacter sacchari]|uniref:Uncharacterized protein n=1 Tax=Acetobacter sacchari TaxID=2661687 RepID=A0ABS3M1L4_9PROT|nr:hypothetical protein [Acetobacter sacchari]MBO1362079.1 hypothetical protein [Acetobacter sacchari]
MTTPTPYVLTLPLTDEQRQAFVDFRCYAADLEETIRAIATPADATLPVVAKLLQADIDALKPDPDEDDYEIDGIESIITGPNKDIDGVAVVALTDAQAAIAAAVAEKDAEIARLNAELSGFRAELSELVAKEVAALAAPDAGAAS